jgi:hypothetical protein
MASMDMKIITYKNGNQLEITVYFKTEDKRNHRIDGIIDGLPDFDPVSEDYLHEVYDLISNKLKELDWDYDDLSMYRPG